MLETIFGRYRNYSLFVLRLFVEIVFFTHGTLKFMGGLQGFARYLAQHDVPLPVVMAPIVMTIEFFGGLGLILGMYTRAAALLLGIVMLVAMLTVTLRIGFAGGYDLNLVCLGGLLSLLLAGPGEPAIGGDL